MIAKRFFWQNASKITLLLRKLMNILDSVTMVWGKIPLLYLWLTGNPLCENAWTDVPSVQDVLQQSVFRALMSSFLFICVEQWPKCCSLYSMACPFTGRARGKTHYFYFSLLAFIQGMKFFWNLQVTTWYTCLLISD